MSARKICLANFFLTLKLFASSQIFSKIPWGIDPQESRLKEGKLPYGDDLGRENREEWGIIDFLKEGLGFQGRIETIPGNYNAFYDNIYEVIRNQEELAVKPGDTVEELKILEACLESNRKRKTIEL